MQYSLTSFKMANKTITKAKVTNKKQNSKGCYKRYSSVKKHSN